MKKVLIGMAVLMFFVFLLSTVSTAGTMGSVPDKGWSAPTPAEAKILDDVLGRIKGHLSEVDINLSPNTNSVSFEKEIGRGVWEKLIVTKVPGAFERYEIWLGEVYYSTLASWPFETPYLQKSLSSADHIYRALFKKIKDLCDETEKLTISREKTKKEGAYADMLKKAAKLFCW